MPKLQEVGMDTLPQGQIQADRFQQANPEDFGQETGAGIERAGAGAAAYSEDEQQIAQDKAQIAAGAAAAQANVWGAAAIQQAQQDPNFSKKYGEDGSGFAKAMETNFQDYATTQIASMPTPESQRFLAGHLTEVGKNFQLQAMDVQSKIGANWAANKVDQTMTMYGAAAAANPAQYGSLKAQMSNVVDMMPHLNEEQRDDFKTKTGIDMASGAAMGWARDNPEVALGTLRPETLAQFKPTPRVEAALADGMKIQLPNNMGGDTVQPYNATKIAGIVNTVKTPNAQLDPLFATVGKAYGIDPTELKLRATAESNLDPKAVGLMTSSGTAKGLAQLTDAKAKELGVTDPFDPGQSITAMAQIMAKSQSLGQGDTAKTDMTYYGGTNSAAWGGNTKQYAENLNAVRMSLHGDIGTNPASIADAANTGNRPPVNEPGMPQFFNDLPWEKQYQVIAAAREGVQFNQTRALQMQTYAKQAQELSARKFMSDSFGKVADKSLNPQDIINNTDLTYADKENMMNGLHADIMGLAKDNAATVNDMYAKIQAPVGDPNRITSESQIWAMVGKGVNVQTAKEASEWLQKRGTPQGEFENQQVNDFLKTGSNIINPKNSFTIPDGKGETNEYNFKTAVRNAIANRPKDVSVMDMLNPTSKNYIGYLIDKNKGSSAPTEASDINPYLNNASQANADGTSPARPLISTQAERDKLPGNSYYTTPDGNLHYKAKDTTK